MSIDKIKTTFYKIINKKYTDVNDKKRDLINLNKYTLYSIDLFENSIKKGTAPRFMKWEYSDLIQMKEYIDEQLLII